MIALLSGKVVELEDKAVVIDVHGVGYWVTVLAQMRKRIKRGDEVSWRIFHHVSSDNEALYGFQEAESLRYFKLLLTVPSVGPRTAMNILEIAPPKILAQAVAEEDTTLLTKVSGVGHKTAERILVELKGKVIAPVVSGVVGSVQEGALEALVSIGFSRQQAREAMVKLPKTVKTVEEAVRAALQGQT